MRLSYADNLEVNIATQYSYASSSKYFGRYVFVVLGLLLVGVVIARQGLNPLTNIGFLIVVILVFLDLATVVIIRSRSPRSFRVDLPLLRVEWADRYVEFPVGSVTQRRGLGWLLNGVVILEAGEEKFVVFNDLPDFRDFVSHFDRM